MDDFSQLEIANPSNNSRSFGVGPSSSIDLCTLSDSFTVNGKVFSEYWSWGWITSFELREYLYKNYANSDGDYAIASEVTHPKANNYQPILSEDGGAEIMGERQDEEKLGHLLSSLHEIVKT